MNNNQNQNRSTGPIIDIQGNETTGRIMRPVAYRQPDVSETLSAAAVSGTMVSEYEYRIRLSETGRRYGKLVLPVPVHEYALSGLLLYALLVFW